MKKLLALLVLICLVGAASAVSLKSGNTDSGSDSSTTSSEELSEENNDVNWPDADVEDNTFNKDQVQGFGKKLIIGGLPNLEDGAPTKVLLWHGNQETSWEDLTTNFQMTDTFFETDADRTEYESENDAISNGDDTTLTYHFKAIDRFLNYVSEEINLPDDVRLEVLMITMRIQNDDGTMEYNMPALGLISRSTKENGMVIYPSETKNGFETIDAPFELGEFDHVQWRQANTNFNP